jgi:hypothetical protein
MALQLFNIKIIGKIKRHLKKKLEFIYLRVMEDLNDS